MSRYTAIHIYETEGGGLRLGATGLPSSNVATYAELSPAQQLAAQLMVHAERLVGDDESTRDDEDADEKADRQVA